MIYRIRMDLSFKDEATARTLMNYAKTLSEEATSVNEGEDNKEIAFCDLEVCRHDEGLPCTRLERVEVRKLEVRKL